MHRKRRNAISGFFSVASIRRLEPIISEHMEKMFRRVDETIEASLAKSAILSMHQVFRACTSDIITTYAFGENQDILGEDDWGKAVTAGSNTWHNLTHVFAAFPIVLLVLRNLPLWAFRLFVPSRELDDLMERKEVRLSLSLFLSLSLSLFSLTTLTMQNPTDADIWLAIQWWVNKVRAIRQSPDPARLKSTIFEGILSSNLPDEEKTDARLAQEAQLIVFAGEGTVGKCQTEKRKNIYIYIYNAKKMEKETRLTVLASLHAQRGPLRAPRAPGRVPPLARRTTRLAPRGRGRAVLRAG